jgi:MFS family permease
MLGLANAFEQPARQSFVMEMVGKDDLINAVALNSGLFNAARLIGPGIGGFIIAAAGVKVAFMLNAISFVPVIGALALMDASRLHTPPPRVRGNPFAELREGLAYTFNTPSAMLIVIALIFVGTFGFNFTVMLPLIDRYALHRGPEALGLLTGALGLGSLVSALLLAGRETAPRRTIFIGGACFAALIGGVAVSQWLLVTMALLVATGIAATAFQATSNTSMQLAAPDHLRGRVMSLYMLLFAGSTPVGGYVTGLMAEHLGVRMAVGICAMLSMTGIVAALLYYITHRQEQPAFAATPALPRL